MIFSFVSHRSATARSLRAGSRAAAPTAIFCAAALLASAAHAQTPVTIATKIDAAPTINAAPTVNAAPTINAAASTRKSNQPHVAAKNVAAKPVVAVKSGAPPQKVGEAKAVAPPSVKSEGAAETASTRAAVAFRPATLLPLSSVGEKTLANGVRGIVQETPGTGVISIQVWVRAGSLYETGGESGAAHLVEMVALRSSRLYPESAGGPRGALEGLGANASSQTTRDATSYSVTIAPRFFGDAMKILGDAVLHPRLLDTEVETSKAEVGSEISRRPVSGLDAATIDLRNAENIAYNAAFARHPYRHPPSGTLQNVLAMNAARVRAFHARRYLGKNISVVVSGEIDAATAQNGIAKNFADAKTSTAPDAVIAAESKAPKARVVTRRGYSPRPTTVLAYRSPSIAQPDDVVAMDVLLAYLGQGRDAALRRVLLGDGATESAVKPTASTRETVPDTPDVQPMPATMLEDRSPENSTATPLPDTPAIISGEEIDGSPVAQSAAASSSATPPAATSSVQTDAAKNASTPESATAEAPHIPPPPVVFLPQISAPRLELSPSQNARLIALRRAPNEARVLAAHAKNSALKKAASNFLLVQDAAPPAPTIVPPKAAPAALAFDTDFLTQRDNGIVAFSLVTDNASRNRAMQLVRDELRRVRGSGIGKAALAAAKTTLLQQYVQQGETPTGRAGALGFYDMIANYKFATTYIARVKRVTDADIRRVAARYFTDKPLVTVLIESPPPPVAPPSSIPDDGGIIA